MQNEIQNKAMKIIHQISSRIKLEATSHSKWDDIPPESRYSYLLQKSSLYYFLKIETDISRLILQLDYPKDLAVPMINLEKLSGIFDFVKINSFALLPIPHICIIGQFEDVLFHVMVEGNKYKKDGFNSFEIPYSTGKLPLNEFFGVT